MLKLRRQDKPQEPVLIVEKLYSIGSASDNNLILREPDVDPIHARLINDEGSITLKDNTSANGCFVNGQRVTQKVLQVGDRVRIGRAEFEVLPLSQDDNQHSSDQQPWQLVADGSWLTGQTFAVAPGDRCVIGRASECNITIAGSHLSRRHCEVSVVGSALRVRDLDSSNGTFINDEPVEDALAYNGDHLRVDVYRFRIVSPDDDSDKTQVRQTIPELTKTIERKTTSPAPRRWKTRPTSPGNRTEPTYREPKPLWPWAVAGLTAVALGALLWWWL